MCLAVVLTTACSSGPGAPGSSASDVASWRSIRDQVFTEAAECGAATATEDCSPVPKARRANLLPLRYYEIDPSYNVPAALRLSEDRPVFEMPTSTEVSTLGGFVTEQLGRIPRVGDRTRLDGYELRVLEMKGRRVSKVLVVRRPQAAPLPEASST